MACLKLYFDPSSPRQIKKKKKKKKKKHLCQSWTLSEKTAEM